ncbi:SpoIIE family protein phosphatase [Streptomyces sp. NPDC048565]|uniref:GAF domain-containing SpoIIE family protein phosphatase n=1 Tax=Streptomyces sp. NPDC048565 TaxID=3155266 RepID=UPI003422FA3B
MSELGRLEALGLAGLSAAADPGMDRFARLVTRLLRVPVSLVSLLETDRQVFPGMVGLAEPWAGRRETPLSHSFCQHVVIDGRPLIIPDTREHARTRTSPAIPDLQVIAYAGMPLSDADGHVLGSLCAIDHVPRQWTEDELQDLGDLAAACSVEMRLRIATERIRQDRDHAEVLLRAAVELGHSHDLADLTRRLRRMFATPSEPALVGLLLADRQGLWRVIDPDDVKPVESTAGRLDLDAGFPSAQAVREQRTVFVPDREALTAAFSPEAVAAYDELGLRSVLCVPLPRRRGVLVWCWPHPHTLSLTEEAALTAVAGYASQAVDRTLFVETRLSTAAQLQAAMLTELPTVPGLDMAALYLPATDQDMVGGDWYDAYQLPPRLPDTPQRALMLSIGDIIGHDVQAAAVMGQVRSMLRQATLGHSAHSPAAALDAVDSAFDALPLGPGATAVHARLDADVGRWHLTWSNAGHPAPLLRTPDGRVSPLEPHDLILLGAPSGLPRHDHECELPLGSVLLLYTDGLVERRDTDIDTTIAKAAATLSAHGDQPLRQLLETLSHGLADAPQRDDVAVLVVRVTGEGT